ncbi:hypothetical protein TIFTF001_006615 [Ficus carica]|uniref:BHLH domain-containing protein n=1 Tax=Ficus carica TaxID=3494 RepID=A0AA87ZN76_FICCA|nr:hypothetical protein TIFTF001_006615 [Ficus carica]
MMAGNPNWWNYMHPPSLYHVLASNTGSSSVFPAFSSLPNSDHDHHLQDHPQSWSQLLLGCNSGLSGEDEERFGQNHDFEPKKLEIWEDQMMISSSTATVNPPPRLPLQIAEHRVKQEVMVSQKSNLYGGGGDREDHHQMIMQQQANDHRQPANCGANWSQVMPAVSSSPRSCITCLGSTTTSNNVLDFSYNKSDNNIRRNQTTDHSASSECNSTATCGAVSNKKARVQSSSSQPPLKVRKEKLGDRITALHQLVSPFGKTDTASVLLEAIGL